LKFAKENQNGRGPTIGPAGPKNERGVTLRSQIGTQILILAKTFQSGRVPNFGTNVPKVVFAYSAKDSGFCESEPKKSWRMLPAKWRKK